MTARARRSFQGKRRKSKGGSKTRPFSTRRFSLSTFDFRLSTSEVGGFHSRRRRIPEVPALEYRVPAAVLLDVEALVRARLAVRRFRVDDRAQLRLAFR